MTFKTDKWTRLGSGENLNAYITDNGIEVYYFSGEYVGKKIIDNNLLSATLDKSTRIYASEFLPLKNMGVAVSDGLFTIINLTKGE